MRKKNKVALIIILIAIIAGATSWSLIKKNKAKQNCTTNDPANSNGECKVDLSSIQAAASLSASTDVSATSSPASSSGVVSGDLYNNKQFGFDLTFNSAWKGYTVSQRTEDKVEAVYDFSIPTKDTNYKNGYAVPLTIKVYSPANYPTNSQLTKIKQTDAYIFAYTIWEQAPSDSAITEKDIANVISTFKLI